MDDTPREPTGLARLTFAVLTGVEATLVTVEVHRGSGLPRETIVGLPGTAVRESFERIRAACASSGLRLAPRRTTVNLAPASQPKSGAGLDLPIALGLLIADGQLPGNGSGQSPLLCLGELALDGDVRAVPGALPVALAARMAGTRVVLVPTANAAEAAAVPDLEVIPVASLSEAVAHVAGTGILRPLDPPAENRAPGHPQRSATTVDLSDVLGQPLARRALEVAAAGGHHLLVLSS